MGTILANVVAFTVVNLDVMQSVGVDDCEFVIATVWV
jgi:hypothetical protein